MAIDHHSHHIEAPNATTPPPQIELVGSVPTPPVPDPSEAMTIHVTLPPGSAGSPPHRHTGPAFGYVIEGERSSSWRVSPSVSCEPGTPSGNRAAT